MVNAADEDNKVPGSPFKLGIRFLNLSKTSLGMLAKAAINQTGGNISFAIGDFGRYYHKPGQYLAVDDAMTHN